MEPGEDVPDKVTSVENKEVFPEMEAGPGEELVVFHPG
jgi:hypothetical protein